MENLEGKGEIVTVSFEEMLARQSVESQQRIAQMTAQLIAEELNLREVRRLRKLTQARLSKKLKIGQEGVSRIEKRTDLYISTLRSYVEGVGGKLKLVVELPDRPPIILSGLGEDQGKMRAKKRAGNVTKSKPRTRRAA
jgi:DNA-binding XRE family transcriptional regulator